jgi:sugar phosphate isomerase/epimerase
MLESPIAVGLWLDDLRLGLRQAIDWARGVGAQAAGLDAFGAEVAPRALSSTGRRELTLRFRSAGLNLAALRADAGGRRLADAATLDANLTRLREALELARALGAARVVIPLGFVPPASDAAGAGAREALAEAVGALGAITNTLGVRPAAAAGAEAPGELAEFLNSRDPAGLFEVDLNPGALLSRGHDPLAALGCLASRVGLASAADFFRGGGEAPFGKGDVPWGELLVGLSTLPRHQALPVLAACQRECDRPAALRSAVARLIELRARPLG